MKYVISTCAALLIVLHLLFPEMKIDAVTLALALIGILPWVMNIFDELEFPGGWKLRFKKMEDLSRRAEDAGLLAAPLNKREQQKYTFQIMADTDRNLALAGLRIEIEKNLKRIAEKNNIGTRMQGAGRLLQMLSEKGLIAEQEKSVLIDMIELLNDAIHGAKVDDHSFGWAMEYGPRILKTLEKKK